MSLTFLRYLAFDGPLRNFFAEDYRGLSRLSTGVTLRFKRDERSRRLFVEDGGFEYFSDDHLGRFRRMRELQHDQGGWGNFLNRSEKEWIVGWYQEYDQVWTGPFKNEPPIEIVVDLRERFAQKEELPSNYNGYPIYYRVRRPMNAQYSSGLPVDCCGRLGTICGTVEDDSSSYAITCGHVGRAVGDVVHSAKRSAGHIGKVVGTVYPKVGGNCNRTVAPAQDGVDACLVELDTNLQTRNNFLTGVAPISAISDGDCLSLHGQGSRKSKKVKVAGANIWKKIDILRDGNEACCGDVFEIEDVNFAYLNSPVTKDGDSGAALLFENTNANWAGMLIGGVGGSSYATYAEHVFDWVCQAVPQASFS